MLILKLFLTRVNSTRIELTNCCVCGKQTGLMSLYFVRRFNSLVHRSFSHFCVVRSFSMTSTMTSSPSLRPVVISGPSGSGKSTLLTKLFQEYPKCFAFSVSHTTRQPRSGEENGKDYHFTLREKFEEMIGSNEFLEHAEFSGNLYGTSKKSVNDILNSGKICILDVEINGVKSIKKSDLKPTPRYIFIKPPSLETLRARLEGRKTETEKSLQKRLDTAKESLSYADIKGSYDHIIINDNLEEAYKTLRDILKEDLELVTKQ